MEKDHLELAKTELLLSDKELASFLSVNLRTVKRWRKYKEKIPGPVKSCIDAWLISNRLGIHWRPDGIDTIGPEHYEGIRKIIEKGKIGDI